ncbi:uncharacterized protein LOC119612172 [Lucilia sericata]|uniref:uncharacterized protein LOC119612172 n=1 Tax=Lucilia sericata TaxID=13632 RepID=UPI0018A848CB|nr:uncharacterized protein LOC119612172 [Lucilia sericata]
MFIRYFKFKNILFLILFFILKFKNYECNTNLNQRFYTNASAMTTFRFRDFEPRYAMKTDAYLKPVLFDRLVRNIRKPRGFQFHADDRDFNVELEFIVPFIRIPIERGMTLTQTAFRSLFNLNLQSLLTTGGIVAVGGIFALILKSVFSQFVYISDYRKTSRNEDANQPDSIQFSKFYSGNSSENVLNINKFASIMESKLQENNINISHCIQRSLCNYAQQNFCNNNSVSGGLPRILDGVFSLDLVRNYLSGTAIKDALDSAKEGVDCVEVYANCNWSFPVQSMLKLAKNFYDLNIT